MSSMNVVDIKSQEKEKKEEKTEEKKAVVNELEPLDLLWTEILKTLDKLEKGVEGDLSALGRAIRNINRFRKRLPHTIWCRIVYTLIPDNYKKEFLDSVKLFINDMSVQAITLISNLASVSYDEAQQKLSETSGSVFDALMVFIAEKEKLAKIEIKKKQEQLKKERLEREKKSGEAEAEAEAESKAETEDDHDGDTKMEDQDSNDDLADINITLIPLKDRRNKRKFYPETYIFLKLLIALELYDNECYKTSIEILNSLISFCVSQNRRTSDLLSSRLYQFYALNMQRLNDGKANNISFLFDNYQNACLQHNEASQSILIVLILQYYINNNLYNLAHKFVEKAEFPQSSESQFYARYHFYRGCIDCVQLNYSDSLYHLEQSIRRAPQTGTYGFKVISTQWLIVIQLLMGDIPDRAIFKPRFDGNSNTNNPMLNAQLLPFLEITQCVKEGNLKEYENVLSKYNNLFIQCGLNKILLRLRHNVIKTGLRKINKSYSKISLADIAHKLGLSSQKNAYFIVSKAIRDGVINAKIDYKNKFVESAQNIHIYNTSQPYNNYSQRIKFCLEIRNNAVKNLRYPPKDEDEEENDKDNNDEFVSPQEIADMIQKHFEDDED